MAAGRRSARQGGALALLLVFGSAAHAFWDPVTAHCEPPALEGRAQAVDGDTLVLDTGVGRPVVVRLVGIDAPELLQDCRDAAGAWDCGREARGALAALVEEHTIACLPCGHDPGGAILAQCRDGEADIGAAMVRAGLATTHAFFSNVLHAAQVEARRAGRGLWRGDWVHPKAWRDGARLGEGPCRGCLVPP